MNRNQMILFSGMLAVASMMGTAFAVVDPAITSSLASVTSGITDAGASIAGYLPAVLLAGLVIGVILFAAPRGWKAFKRMSS